MDSFTDLANSLKNAAAGAVAWHQYFKRWARSRQALAAEISRYLNLVAECSVTDRAAARLVMKTALVMLRRDGLVPPNPRRAT